MRKYSSIFFLLMLVTISYGQDMFKENILTKFKGQHEYLLSCIDLLEEKDLTFKPSEDEMTTRDLI